ncbi:MAG: hypothetical protein AAF569_02340 [Pseudomonadota bacterium]
MTDKWRKDGTLKADLVSLQDYLEQRHGPAMAQVLIDDLVTLESVQQAA